MLSVLVSIAFGSTRGVADTDGQRAPVCELALPPVAVVTARAIGRMAVDRQFDVGNAEVAQRRGVNLVQQAQRFALRTPVNDAGEQTRRGAQGAAIDDSIQATDGGR